MRIKSDSDFYVRVRKAGNEQVACRVNASAHQDSVERLFTGTTTFEIDDRKNEAAETETDVRRIYPLMPHSE